MANYGPKPLTERERLFVEAYCTEASFDGSKAAKLAGYSQKGSARQAAKLLERDNIARAIKARIEKKKREFRISEELVVERLWQEANYMGKGTSHAARINALVWLGKHIAMWEEKKADHYTGDTYNIIQYSSPEQPKIEAAIEENKKEIEENKDIELPEGVLLAKYD